MNYCKGCKHFRLGLGSEAICARFAKVETTESLVWGIRENRTYPTCDEARKEGGQCGIDGKGWERPEIPPEPNRRGGWYPGY